MRKTLMLIVGVVGCSGQVSDDATRTSSEALNGDTWTQIVTSSGIGFGASYAAAFAAPQGVLIGGVRYDNANETSSSCTVRRTTDGTTFTNDEIFDYVPNGNCFTSAIVALPSSVTYAAEIAKDTGGGNHLLFRKSVSGVGGYLTDKDISYGTTVEPAQVRAALHQGVAYVSFDAFNTSTLVQTPQLYSSSGGAWTSITPPPNVTLRNICSTSQGLMLVASSGRSWQVYTSTNLTSWSLSESYTAPGTVTVSPSACAEVNGVIYVAGVYLDTGTTWIVRKLTGTSWTTVESETSSDAYGPSAIGPGKNNRAYFAGTQGASNLSAHAHTLRWDPITGWQDSDHVTGDGSELYGYAYSPTLGAYTVGRNGANNAIVRRLVP